MSKIVVKNIIIENFDPKEHSANFKVNFLSDSKEKQIVKRLQLKHPLSIVNHLFLAVKSKDKIILDRPPSDPIEALEMYSPIKIENEDDTEEKIINFITHLCTKAKSLKTNTSATVHMKIVNEFKTARLDLIPDQKEKKQHDSSYLKMFKRNMKI